MHPPATWPGGAEAALTLSFDDGLAHTCDSTVSWLTESGITATYNVITDCVGETFDGLTTAGWEDWAAAQERGHEIASHGARHLPLSGPAGQLGQLARAWLTAPDPLAYARQLVGLARRLVHYQAPERARESRPDPLAEALRSRTAIADRLPQQPVDSFVYPAGRHNRTARRAVALAGYRSARGLQPGLNDPTTDRYALRALVITPDVSHEYLQRWLRRAMSRNSWLILAFHLVSDQNPTHYPYVCSTESFRSLIRQLQALPLWIAPQRAVIAWWEESRV